MERTLSVDEKIRRAEEIYQRKKMQNERKSYATVNVRQKPEHKTIKKMLLQIAICFVIYLIYYLIQNSNYIFSEDVLNKTKEILSYNINFQEKWNEWKGYLKLENLISKQEENQEPEQQNTEIDENILQNEISNTVGQMTNTVEAVLSAQDTMVEETTKKESSLSQMELDANYIKETLSFIKPLSGVITSRFGNRNPTTETVPKYHTGIDIAADTGTVIVAATEGIVSVVSSEGDYGNHVKILNGNIMTLYAHCNKIYVNEGDAITQGQSIAEVGATGNVTGPHLHFEIRLEDRIVDPEYVLGAM